MATDINKYQNSFKIYTLCYIIFNQLSFSRFMKNIILN